MSTATLCATLALQHLRLAIAARAAHWLAASQVITEFCFIDLMLVDCLIDLTLIDCLTDLTFVDPVDLESSPRSLYAVCALLGAGEGPSVRKAFNKTVDALHGNTVDQELEIYHSDEEMEALKVMGENHQQDNSGGCDDDESDESDSDSEDLDDASWQANMLDNEDEFGLADISLLRKSASRSSGSKQSQVSSGGGRRLG